MEFGGVDREVILRREAVGAIAAAALAVLVAAAGAFASGMLPAQSAPRLAAQAAFVYVCGAALVWRALPGGHPHARLGPANRVTLLRLAIVALLAGAVGSGVPATAAAAWALAGLASVGAALDAVDGALARRSGLASAFGARFDLETDALMTLVLAALVLQSGKAGAWILLAGALRYAFVAAAALWPWLAAPLAPSVRRQAVCVVQIATLVVVLLPPVAAPLSRVLAVGSLAALCASFAADVLALARARRIRPTLEPSA